MSEVIAVKVPDIGDFADVPVIELFVKVGDVLAAEEAICTLESDKATVDVPAPLAGTVREVLVSLGDKVSTGSVLLQLEVATQPTLASEPSPAPPPPVAAASAAAASVPAPVAAKHEGGFDLECDLLVLGAGPGGYSAAFRAADLGLRTVLVERYPTLGGVCLNVGCIPSKALLHVAAVMEEAVHLGDCGVRFAAPEIDIDGLRAHKDRVIAKLTAGLAGMVKARKVEVVHGHGRFVDPYHLDVALTEGSAQASSAGKQIVRFKQAIIAAGSQALKLPFMPEDPRIVDSTGVLALKRIPQKMLVIGGGIIGLEMATVYSALGARIDVVEMLDGLMQGADRDLVKVWEKANRDRFDNIWLKTRTVAADAREDGIYVLFEGLEGNNKAPAEPQCYDLVLVAVGRSPNGGRIDADKAGVIVSERGFIDVDAQMRTNVSHIFAIGDTVGQPMLAHKAVHEAHVAAEAAAGMKVAFDALQIPSVAYTDPEVAWTGLTEEQAKKQGVQYSKAQFPWAASGRAIANTRDEGFTKLLFAADSQRIIGGGIVGTHAGELISEVCLAVEMGADAIDIGKTIHPHPTLGESIGMAAEVAHGSCTDLPPQRKR